MFLWHIFYFFRRVNTFFLFFYYISLSLFSKNGFTTVIKYEPTHWSPFLLFSRETPSSTQRSNVGLLWVWLKCLYKLFGVLLLNLFISSLLLVQLSPTIDEPCFHILPTQTRGTHFSLQGNLPIYTIKLFFHILIQIIFFPLSWHLKKTKWENRKCSISYFFLNDKDG